MHAGTTGGGEHQDRLALGSGGFDGTGDFFSHHTAHAGTKEAEIHDGQQDRHAFDQRPSCDGHA